MPSTMITWSRVSVTVCPGSRRPRTNEYRGSVVVWPDISDEQVLVEQVHVERAQRLEVHLAVLIARRQVAIDEVVVQCQRERVATVRQQLHGEPLRERRLARRGRAGHEHDADAIAGGDDLRGYLGDARFVQRLGDERNLLEPPLLDGIVQRAGVADAELVEPLPRFLEHLEQLRVRLDVRHFERPGLVRKAKQEARGEPLEPEPAQASGRRHHVALKVVAAAAQLVEHERVAAAVRQQARLVELSAIVEQLRRLADRHDRFLDRLVRGHDRPHARLERAQVLAREGCAATDRAEVAADRRRRVLDHHVGFGKDLGGGRHQQKRERAPVDARAVGVRDAHRGHIRIRHEPRLQLAQPSIDDRRNHRRAPLVTLWKRDPENIAQRRAGRRLENPAVRQPRVDALARSGEPDPGGFDGSIACGSRGRMRMGHGRAIV